VCSHGEDNREDTAGERLSKDKQTGPDQDPQVRICTLWCVLVCQSKVIFCFCLKLTKAAFIWAKIQ